VKTINNIENEEGVFIVFYHEGRVYRLLCTYRFINTTGKVLVGK
jgi:hypothetical protein